MPGFGGESERSKAGTCSDVKNLVVRFRPGESNEARA